MWRIITEDDVYSVLNDTEAAVLRESLLQTGQADPLTTIIAQVTQRARDAIRSNPDNRTSPVAAELPDGVIGEIVPIIVYRLAQRLSRVLEITADRSDSNKAALDYLAKIARGPQAGGLAVEQYGAAPAATGDAPRVETLAARTAINRGSLSGL